MKGNGLAKRPGRYAGKVNHADARTKPAYVRVNPSDVKVNPGYVKANPANVKAKPGARENRRTASNAASGNSMTGKSN